MSQDVIKGGARLLRCPHQVQTIKKKLMWVVRGGGAVAPRGGVCRCTQTQSLTVVACVILQCIPCVNECRCME